MDEAEALAESEDPEAHYVTRILHERVRLDVEYVDLSSLRYDLAVLFRQAVAIVRKRA
jgi:lipopolysaccharide/colanic/teichoic acid biosynthesis glycosyltransferase